MEREQSSLSAASTSLVTQNSASRLFPSLSAASQISHTSLAKLPDARASVKYIRADGKTDGRDDVGRSKAIVQFSITPFDEIQLFSWVDNRVGARGERVRYSFLKKGVAQSWEARVRYSFLTKGGGQAVRFQHRQVIDQQPSSSPLP
jgi:hypothetical protein